MTWKTSHVASLKSDRAVMNTSGLRTYARVRCVVLRPIQIVDADAISTHANPFHKRNEYKGLRSLRMMKTKQAASPLWVTDDNYQNFFWNCTTTNAQQIIRAFQKSRELSFPMRFVVLLIIRLPTRWSFMISLLQRDLLGKICGRSRKVLALRSEERLGTCSIHSTLERDIAVVSRPCEIWW